MLSCQPVLPLDTVAAPPLLLAERARRMVPSDTRALFSMAAREDVVSLAGGMPSSEALPAQALRTVLGDVLRTDGPGALQYGSAQGDLVLRGQICEVMAAEGIAATPDEVLVTVGSQQALDLVTRILVDPGDTVVTEGPTYVTALSTFAAGQARVVEVAMDKDGVVPQALADAFALCAAEGRPAKFFYTVPTFHNPTGLVLGAGRRKEVLEICRRAGVLVVEDNPYGLLHFGEEPHRALCADAPDGVVYLGSFSKTFAPGLRVGWVRAPRALAGTLVLAAESAMLSHSGLAQRAVSRFLGEWSWQGHLDAARSLYRGRRDAMLDELAVTMPDGVSWTVPEGGFFVWVTLPGRLDARAMMPRAIDSGVAYVPGSGFHTRGGAQNLRLSYSYPPASAVREGVRRLSDVIRDEVAGAGTHRLREAVAR
ncbi:PLP-dependent aminotransferase family protein [Streptomyces sp. NBC_01089]|uniref:aminotransferase-like domain-containing protein n=1 Tax=Streptomyces sp. NBC_01089 TaxID=2903747 RepID=UPI0038674BBC|nr:PLP-dependent aminotransferase family protein [Streptomyces sp. NBC_01089]WSU46373.1 PLP-dependent aminotransferase family protein [Streptomyces sp. NBC_01089]